MRRDEVAAVAMSVGGRAGSQHQKAHGAPSVYARFPEEMPENQPRRSENGVFAGYYSGSSSFSVLARANKLSKKKEFMKPRIDAHS